jgi:hypothetical protein
MAKSRKGAVTNQRAASAPAQKTTSKKSSVSGTQRANSRTSRSSKGATKSRSGLSQQASLLLVNMIPRSLSNETEQDSEPHIAVNPTNLLEIVGTAFTPDPAGGPFAPIFVSNDGGNTWTLRSTVQSSVITGDISVAYAGANLYTGILRRPGNLVLGIMRTNNALGTTPMTMLSSRSNVDQPFITAGRINGNDSVYVGSNDFAAPGSKTATIDHSQNATAVTPTFRKVRIEARNTGSAGQDGPQVRPVAHADGTVYAIFYGWRSFTAGNQVTADVVVVRDDRGGAGSSPFKALIDSGDGLAGQRVAQSVTFVWDQLLGNQRTGGAVSIAVDPRDSAQVYIAWADKQATTGYTLHVRRSTDRGQTWTAQDLRTVAQATNPALAINSAGTLAFLYQKVIVVAGKERWVTQVDRTSDGINWNSLILADVPADAPAPVFQPYIGDYVHMVAVDRTFLGIFSANNTPDPTHFPNGVVYQRNHNFSTRRLFRLDGVTTVRASIDPFFFRLAE